MSKNITIQEGGVARSFGSVSKLQTSLSGGGSCYWVPEDETKLKTKHITKNGTYTASDDAVYGYKQVTVNVAGGKGSADSSGKPSGGDIKPGGSGSAVIGTNPSTGNEEVVGVDDDGNLVTTPVPSSIYIITPPTKTEYTVGETIDYSGIVVGLRNKDGSTFTDATYPNGHIPMGELIFPVEVAPEAMEQDEIRSADEPVSTAGQDIPVIPPNTPLYFYENGRSGYGIAFLSPSRSIVLNLEPGIRLRLYVVGTTPIYSSDLMRANISDGVVGQWHDTSLIVVNDYKYNGQIVYSGTIGTGYSPAEITINYPYVESIDGAARWIAVYGTIKSGGASIPVQWPSPYTGETLEDTFEITVSAAGSSSESSSGREGSGGGGEF